MTVRRDFIDLLRKQERDLDDLWDGLADSVVTILSRYADRDGNIPLSRWRQIRIDIQNLLTRFVVNQPQQAAWNVLSTGAVFPTTPFMQLLWATLEASTRLAVKEHADFLTQYVANEIQGTLRRAFLDPFERLNDLPPEEASVLRRWVHPLEATRGDGLQLEQRLPMAAADMGRRTNALINVLLSEGKTAQEMADEIRNYFSGRSRRVGVWGQRAGERLLRVARSEPVFAFGQASTAAAGTNPFITAVYVNRGRSVPCAICDSQVKGNPYTLETVPQIGFHANCMCYYSFRLSGDPAWETSDAEWLRTIGALSGQYVELLLRIP